MKKKIIIYLACLAGLVLVSSCSTRNTIIKRHYMKGYYVDKHDRSHSTAAANAPAHLRTEKEAVSKLSVSLKPEKIDEPLLAQRTRSEITPVITAKAAPARSTRAVTDQKISKPSVRLNERMHLKKPMVRDSSDGLSLFWIVILVILILWAVGFLAGGFGIGNLINLLLVVALVLLILWLLKVI